MHRKALVLICIVVILFVIAAAFEQNTASVFQKHSQDSTTTSKIQFVSSTITASGVVTAQRQQKLTFQAVGKVIYLPFREGDKVLRGQIVAQLDRAKLEANLRQAEQDFTAAKASSEKLYNDTAGKTDESYDEKIKRTAVDAAQNKAYDSVVKARQDIADATLISSLNGILTHADVTTPGVTITPATSFTVADLQSIVFRANIPAGSIYYITEGSTVTLALDGLSDKILGTVTKIYPSKVTLPNGQTVYQADIESDDLKKMAKLDDSGSALISTNAQHVALVPAWTVLGGKYIWIDNNGTPELKTISVGKIHGDQIEIISGLSTSDKIIIDPKHLTTRNYLYL